MSPRGLRAGSRPATVAAGRQPSVAWCSRRRRHPAPRLIWDDGTANPEPCLDQFTLVSKYGALGWLLGGMSVFGVVGTWAKWSAPEKHVPWVSRCLPPPTAPPAQW